MDFTGIGSIADFAKGIFDKFWPPDADPNEKLKAVAEVQTMIEARESKLIDAQKSIIVAEMEQSDKFTKRARPAVVYSGLGFIFLNHVLAPITAYVAVLFGNDILELPTLELPNQFWWAWTSVCSIWVIGRSAEKRGVNNNIVKLITGS